MHTTILEEYKNLDQGLISTCGECDYRTQSGIFSRKD